MADETLTRSESKALTRERLLDAALKILDDQGEAALTTINVTRAVGLAQSSFYVHFQDMDDLLAQLMEQLRLEQRATMKEARRLSRSAPRDRERLRDTFRIPLDDRLAHPQLFRIVLRSRLDQASRLGDWSKTLSETGRKALVEDLIKAGMCATTPEERRKVEMAAEGLSRLIDTFALGHLEGRFPDREQIVDMLVAFFWGAYGHVAAGKGRRRPAHS